MDERRIRSFKRPILISLALVALMLGASAVMWVSLPEGTRLPVHWGFDGNPDRYGSKLEGGLVLPVIALCLALLLAVLPRIEPRRRHFLESSKAYVAIWLSVIGLMAAIHVNGMLLALGQGFDMLRLAMSLVGILFMVMGNYFGKIRSTFFLGIRTPWTLSSDRVWDKTHRLGGLVYFAVGLVTLLMAAGGFEQAALIALVAGSIGGSLALVAYSFILWRREQRSNETPGASSAPGPQHDDHQHQRPAD